jgi:tetratricopeptide (TPR) repeat protein
MLNNCSVAYLQGGDANAALKTVQGTEMTFFEAGDFKRQAIAIGNRAAALDALGQLEEAADAYEESAEILDQVGDKELFTSVMQALSGLLRQNRQLEALATMQAG